MAEDLSSYDRVREFLSTCTTDADNALLTAGGGDGVFQTDPSTAMAESWGENGEKLSEAAMAMEDALSNYHKAINVWNNQSDKEAFPGPKIESNMPTSLGLTGDWGTNEGFDQNLGRLQAVNDVLRASFDEDAELIGDHPGSTVGIDFGVGWGAFSDDPGDGHKPISDHRILLNDAIDTLTDQTDAPFEAMQKCKSDLATVNADEEGCALSAIIPEWLSAGSTTIKHLPCPDFMETEDAAAEAKRMGENADLAMANPGLANALVHFEGARDFKEQCFLLAKIFELAQYKKETFETTKVPKRLPYIAPPPGNSGSKGNACLMADGDPYAFVNRLTQHPNQKVFFDMHNKDISTLMPMIRLYKVNTEGTNETQQEYTFQSNTTKAEIDKTFASKGKRGYGVGVKDFSFVYDGNNPFAAKKSIKAKLTIFANSFDELLQERDPPESGGSVWSYIELALKTGKALTATDKKGKTAAQIEEIENNLAKLDFRLKAIVGWSKPKGRLSHFGQWGVNEFGTVYKKEDLLDAIYDSHMTLNLTPVTHEFNLDDMGRVTFVISYLAYVDDFFDQSGFNIFFDVETNLKMLKRKLKYKTLTKECKAAKVAEAKKEELKGKEVKLEKQKAMQSILQRLFVLDRVKYIEIGFGELVAFETEGPYYEMSGSSIVDRIVDQSLLGSVDPNLISMYASAMDAQGAFSNKTDTGLQNEFEFALAASDPRRNTLPFFYVSDLMDAILGGIENKLEKMPKQIGSLHSQSDAASSTTTAIAAGKLDPTINPEDVAAEKEKLELFAVNFKKFRLLLGPLEIVNPKDGETSLFVNFGDVPISVKYFIEWMTDKLLKKDESVYSLSKFLSDFFNDLIKNFLNDSDCFSGAAKQKARLNQAVITSYRSSGELRDEFTAAIQKQHPLASRGVLHKMSQQPILNISGESLLPDGGDGGIGREINYMVFYAGRTQPTELMKGNRVDDEARGIFHYMLGKNRGIVKKIDLSKTTSTGLREVRFEQEGYDGLEQLREVYDVNVTTYANVKAWPGTYIYVDPHGWSPMATDLDLTKLGIGGYCMIIRSEHTFGPGQAETKITAKWVSSNDGDSKVVMPEGEDEDTGKEKSSGAGAGTNSSVMCNFGKRKEGLMDKFMGFLGGSTETSTDDGSTPQPGEATP